MPRDVVTVRARVLGRDEMLVVPDGTGAEGRRGSCRRWRRAVGPVAWAGTLVAAAAVRLVYDLGWAVRQPLVGDAWYYHYQAKALAAGKGFIEPYLYYDHKTFGLAHPLVIPAAAHPPAFSAMLAAGDLVGLASVADQRLVGVGLGVLCVAVIGLVAKRLAGWPGAVAASGAAAAYPPLWLADPGLMSEALFGAVVAGFVLAVVRFLDRPGWGRALVVGVVYGAGVLTRGEFAFEGGVVLGGLAIAGLVRAARRRGRGGLRRAGMLGVACLVGAGAVAPWSAWMLTHFKQTELISTQLGRTVADSSCNETFYGPYTGYWTLSCQSQLAPAAKGPPDWGLDRSVQDHQDLAMAERYIEAHLGRLPAVMAARVGRVLGVWHLSQQEDLDLVSNLWPLGADRAGWLAWFVLAGLSAVGAVAGLCRRMWSVVWVFAGMCAANLAVVALVYGATRFRLPTDICAVIGGSLGALWLGRAGLGLATRSTVPTGGRRRGRHGPDVAD